MKRSFLKITARIVPLAALVALGALAARASADPAAAADSAWSPVADNDGPPLADPVAERGREVFHQRCEACHGAVPDGNPGAMFMRPGTLALAARYRGTKPAALAERTDLTTEFVAVIVRNGINTMPFFRPTEVSGDDLKALGAYLARKRDQRTVELPDASRQVR